MVSTCSSLVSGIIPNLSSTLDPTTVSSLKTIIYIQHSLIVKTDSSHCTATISKFKIAFFLFSHLCAKNSSLITVELASNWTQSMAMVGVSAIITLRMEFATDRSVSSSWKVTISDVKSVMVTLGWLAYGIAHLWKKTLFAKHRKQINTVSSSIPCAAI